MVLSFLCILFAFCFFAMGAFTAAALGHPRYLRSQPCLPLEKRSLLTTPAEYTAKASFGLEY